MDRPMRAEDATRNHAGFFGRISSAAKTREWSARRAGPFHAAKMMISPGADDEQVGRPL